MNFMVTSAITTGAPLKRRSYTTGVISLTITALLCVVWLAL